MESQTLSELIDQAEAEHKWLYYHYQNMWFSPQELRDANAEGRFRWRVVNWRLRDPQEKLKRLREHVKPSQKELEEFKEKIGR